MDHIASVLSFNTSVTSHEVTCVQFSASWCQPCKRVRPLMDLLVENNPGINFLYVDVDTMGTLADHYKVDSVPCFIGVHKNANICSRLTGSDENKIREFVRQLAVSR